MPRTHHTSLSLRTHLNGVVAAISSCDPADFFSTSRVVQQLTDLRSQAERDRAQAVLPLCTVALHFAEALNREPQLSPKAAKDLLAEMLAAVCTTLGVETEGAPTGDGELPQLPAGTVPEAAPAGSTKTAGDARAPMPVSSGTTAKRPGLKLVSNKRLGEMLVQMSLLTPTQVEQALNHQRVTGCRLGEALIQMRILTRETIESALRMQGARRATTDNPWTMR
jgi:hypothetical protein